MKLYEYVIKYDEKGISIAKYCKTHKMDEVQWITEGYCPCYYKCFTDTKYADFKCKYLD